ALALGHPLGRGGGFAGGRAGLLPGLAAVAGALDDLAEPAAGLRGVDAVGIDGRALEVVDLPAGKVRAADLPLLALAVGVEDEGALARADEYAYAAHDSPSGARPHSAPGRALASSLVEGSGGVWIDAQVGLGLLTPWPGTPAVDQNCPSSPPSCPRSRPRTSCARHRLDRSPTSAR